MDFEIVGELRDVEAIAVGPRIREINRLRRSYGTGRWKKMKGAVEIRTRTGMIRLAEVHWYQAHGKGQVEFKLKRYLDGDYDR